MTTLYRTPVEMNTFYQGLMQRSWIVQSLDPIASTEMTQTDRFRFTSDMRIERSNGTGLWADWAKSCVVGPDGLTGSTLHDGRQFLIQGASDSQLTCAFMDSTQQATMLRAVALGTAAGGVAGALAGMVAGSWVAGTLTGIAAGFAGSFVARGYNPETQTGPGATLAVDEGHRPPPDSGSGRH